MPAQKEALSKLLFFQITRLRRFSDEFLDLHLFLKAVQRAQDVLIFLKV